MVTAAVFPAGIFQKAALLQPLEELHESRRRDLLKTLSELLHDREALSLLEETVRPMFSTVRVKTCAKLCVVLQRFLKGTFNIYHLLET